MLKRLEFARAVYWRRWSIIPLLVLAANLYDFTQAQVAEKDSDWPRIGDFLGGWPWWGWTILFLLLVLLIGFEAAFRQARSGRWIADARLDLSPPQEYPDETIDQDPVKLWRVTLENTTPATVARKARVRVEKSAPALSLLPVTLHRQHDNIAPYQQEADIRHGEAIAFDVIGQDRVSSDSFYLFRSDAHGSDQPGYAYILSPAENKRIVEAIYHRAGWRFTVSVVADPPAHGTEQDYVLYDDGGRLHMRRDDEASPQ